MWLARYLATLAKNTSWSRDFILWSLAYCEGLQLQHSYWRDDDIWTVPIIPEIAPVVAVEQMLDTWRKEMEDDEQRF